MKILALLAMACAMYGQDYTFSMTMDELNQRLIKKSSNPEIYPVEGALPKIIAENSSFSNLITLMKIDGRGISLGIKGSQGIFEYASIEINDKIRRYIVYRYETDGRLSLSADFRGKPYMFRFYKVITDGIELSDAFGNKAIIVNGAAVNIIDKNG